MEEQRDNPQQKIHFRVRETSGRRGPGALMHLAMLFLHPSLAMVVAQVHSVWKSVMLVLLLIGIASGCSTAVSTCRRYSKTAQEVIAGIGDDVAPLRLQEGRIFWNPALPDEYSKTVGNFRIQISASFPSAKTEGVQHGLLIARNRIDYWNRGMGEERKFMQMTIVNDRKLVSLEESLNRRGRDVESLLPGWSPEKGLDKAGMEQLCTLLCRVMFPAAMLFHGLDFLRCVFFCMLVFIVSTFVFRQAGGRSFHEMFVLAMNMSVPPALISWIWAAAAPWNWDFQTIYFAAFLFYMIFLFVDTRRFLSNGAREQDRE